MCGLQLKSEACEGTPRTFCEEGVGVCGQPVVSQWSASAAQDYMFVLGGFQIDITHDHVLGISVNIPTIEACCPPMCILSV